MTCIVGIAENGRVYMGCDSAAIQDWESRITRMPKVFILGEFIIGYTTSFRMGQILRHFLEVRKQESGEDTFSYMVKVFSESVRDCLKAKAFTTVSNNTERGGQFLVGYHGRLYSAESDFQVSEWCDDFSAIGVGAPYALGALKALDGKPRQRIIKALSISTYFCIGVRKPFKVLSL